MMFEKTKCIICGSLMYIDCSCPHCDKTQKESEKELY